MSKCNDCGKQLIANDHIILNVLWKQDHIRMFCGYICLRRWLTQSDETRDLAY